MPKILRAVNQRFRLFVNSTIPPVLGTICQIEGFLLIEQNQLKTIYYIRYKYYNASFS